MRLTDQQLGDLLTDAQNVQALVRDPTGLIQKVIINSEWTPPGISADYPLRPSASGTKPSALLRLFKPRVDLVLAPPFKTVTWAPAGNPSSSKWAWASAGGILIGLLAIKGALSFFKGR